MLGVLATLIDKISEAHDQDALVIGISLDFTKVFGTMDHGICLNLESYSAQTLLKNALIVIYQLVCNT